MRHHTFAMAVMMSVHRSCCIRQFLINSTFVLVTVVVAVVVVIGVKITRPMWTFICNSGDTPLEKLHTDKTVQEVIRPKSC